MRMNKKKITILVEVVTRNVVMVGFSITDMFHYLKRKCIGIGLKGSCCLSLLALLKAAGVEQPKFR